MGYSAGGVAVVRAMCQHGDIFKVGAAICGNYYPQFYISMWADKYVGDIPIISTALTPDVANLRGPVLLISGDMDFNVQPSQTVRLVAELVNANKEFELALVPNQGHLVLFESGYAQRKMWDFFVKNLTSREPPRSLDLRFEDYELTRFRRLSRLGVR